MNLSTFDPTHASAADISAAQTALGVTVDDDFGPESLAALADWREANPQPAADGEWHEVIASSFADPADVAAFQRHKAMGDSDQQAFKYGDNGIGLWGDPCYQGSGPRCALPPEVWHALPHPRLAHVEVQANGKTVVAELGDTMPHEANIHNGAGLDMSPDLCAALGIRIPAMAKVQWRWAV